MENKRSFFRLQLRHPLAAELRMIGIDDQQVISKTMKTAVLDISAGGVRFISTGPLPEQRHLLVELKFTAMGREYKPLGVIVRTVSAGQDDQQQYCVQFSLNEQDTASLAGVINQLAVKLRSTPTLSSCSFCTEEDLERFHSVLTGTGLEGPAGI